MTHCTCAPAFSAASARWCPRTEAINGVVEKTRRLAHGFRNFTNYRIRILLAADGSRPYRRRPTVNPQPC